ncbi:MAG: hypothetical protein KF741_10425 [Ferruginibacter sp.]|nr:hypothetical protein [Bacteroidota bacterium]MBX2919644.1 hypothetical protein [Ferruginibacter sp.]MCB0708503.1 hypothetical protein [Chitinophagaceae bacterium]MCC7379161.1 hypothetical protein [Chitinophagaceae bacterium]
MLKKYFFLLLLFTTVISCNNESAKTPKTDVDVARAFVRNILDDNFKEAEQYLLKDDTNMQIFERFKKQYNQKGKEVLEKYKNADIIVNEISYITDTVCIFNYSNSYNITDKTPLKVVRIDGKWLIDLKYTFSGNL